jgi:hypothetical protein
MLFAQQEPLASSGDFVFRKTLTTTIAPMSKKQVTTELKAIKLAGQTIRKTPENAKAFLVKHGFATRAGKLTKRYGG